MALSPDITSVPDRHGYFGRFGGRFVPETLMTALLDLEREYETARKDPSFQKELDDLLREFVGRPTPLYFAERLTTELGGARITSSARIFSTPAPTRSTTRSDRSCSRAEWARSA